MIRERPSRSDEPAEFDAFAATYDDVLNRALSISGDDKRYFVNGRVTWLRQALAKRNCFPKHVLDYGCGTGSSAQYFFDLLGAESFVGVDVSEGSLEIARRANEHQPAARFLSCASYRPAGNADLAYCNGVFHHIPPAGRQASAAYVFRSLRPGGIFAFWENNPWNPGARYCMHVNPFDRDAIPLSPSEACNLLNAVGFEILERSYLFIFPRMLSWLRRLEPPLCRVPLGAQYLVLGRRP